MADQIIVFELEEQASQDHHQLEESEIEKPVSIFTDKASTSFKAEKLNMKKLRVLPRQSQISQLSDNSPQPLKNESLFIQNEPKPFVIQKFSCDMPEGTIYVNESPPDTAKFNQNQLKPYQNLQQPSVSIDMSENIYDKPIINSRPMNPLSIHYGQELSAYSKETDIIDTVGLGTNASPQQHFLQTISIFRVQRVLLFPQKFHLTINGNHILTARKKLIQSNSLYFFFNSQDDLSTRGNHYIGYMEANFNGTEYSIFTHDKINIGLITHLIKKDQQTRSNFYFPKKIMSKAQPIRNRVLHDDKSIGCVSTKKANFNEKTGKYSLSFGGRALMSSAKNCIMETKQKNALVMGKVKEKHYNLDFGYPFSQLTAFAFAISNYEDKLGENAKY